MKITLNEEEAKALVELLQELNGGDIVGILDEDDSTDDPRATALAAVLVGAGMQDYVPEHLLPEHLLGDL